MKYENLAPDFVALQADLAPLEKSAVNPFFKSKYAPLPEVRAAMQPLLAKHNFGLAVVPEVIEGENGLHFMLIHKSGEVIDGYWKLTPGKKDSQGEGADTTYKRRFGEMSIVGLVADEDDDGNTASFRPAAAPVKASKPAAPPSEADKKRNELRSLAGQRGWELAKIAKAFSDTVTVDGKPGDLKKASADDIESFIVSLEAGVVVP